MKQEYIMKLQLDIKLTLSLAAFVIFCLISGCLSASGKQSGLPENAVVCEDPRPTICTREYRPVCGHFADGTVKTFGNPCTACGDKKVVGFTHGPCSK